MKKVLVGMFALVMCAGMAMAGTKYIKYACGDTVAVGSTTGSRDQTSTSNDKCPTCKAAEEKEKMCKEIGNDAANGVDGAADYYFKKGCYPVQ